MGKSLDSLPEDLRSLMTDGRKLRRQTDGLAGFAVQLSLLQTGPYEKERALLRGWLNDINAYTQRVTQLDRGNFIVDGEQVHTAALVRIDEMTTQLRASMADIHTILELPVSTEQDDEPDEWNGDTGPWPDEPSAPSSAATSTTTVAS